MKMLLYVLLLGMSLQVGASCGTPEVSQPTTSHRESFAQPRTHPTKSGQLEYVHFMQKTPLADKELEQICFKDLDIYPLGRCVGLLELRNKCRRKAFSDIYKVSFDTDKLPGFINYRVPFGTVKLPEFVKGSPASLWARYKELE